MKDYDLIIIYHPGKTNVVANADSRRYFSNATAMIISHGPIVEDIMRLKLQVLVQGNNMSLTNMVVWPTLFEQIKAAQEKGGRWFSGALQNK